MPNPKVLGSLIVPYETHQEYFILKSKEILFFNISIDKSPDSVKAFNIYPEARIFPKTQNLLAITKKSQARKNIHVFILRKLGFNKHWRRYFNSWICKVLARLGVSHFSGVLNCDKILKFRKINYFDRKMITATGKFEIITPGR